MFLAQGALKLLGVTKPSAPQVLQNGYRNRPINTKLTYIDSDGVQKHQQMRNGHKTIRSMNIISQTVQVELPSDNGCQTYELQSDNRFKLHPNVEGIAKIVPEGSKLVVNTWSVARVPYDDTSTNGSKIMFSCPEKNTITRKMREVGYTVVLSPRKRRKGPDGV